MKLYFDIDGVLLTRDKQVPDGARELLNFATKNYSCYWLTTHCRAGSNKAFEYLSQYYPETDHSQLLHIGPADWMESKTEGLDWDSDFLWFDDFAFEFERVELKRENRLESLIIVDLSRPGELFRILGKLK